MTDCGCGCCAGIASRTPQQHENRPGLPTVDYRVGRHGDFVASMRAELSRVPDQSPLSALRTRADDDPTIALIDAWATACDILSFYTERLAVESYLRTSTERASLQELGRLVAYRLAPGAAAETPLAFALEDAAPPSTGPPTPGSAPPPVPTSVTLPVGLRVQSVPGPGERPQTFETVEELEARPGWNAMPVVDTVFVQPHMNQRRAWFEGTDAGILPGQALLLASEDLANDRWDVRIVTEVHEDAANDRTMVRWDRGLGSWTPVNRPADAPEALVLRKRLRVFGHQAPMWRAMDATYRANYDPEGKGTGSDWPGFESVSHQGEEETVVRVDGAHPELVVGDWVVLSQEDVDFYRELYEIVERSEESRAEFAISTTVTRLVLRGEQHAFGNPRLVTVLAVGSALTLVEEPDERDLTTETVTVDGDATAMQPGRRVVLTGQTPGGRPHAEVVVLARATAAPLGRTGPRTTLTLRTPPALGFARSSCTVLGNIALATQGETVTEILGSGDARVGFQAFGLRQLPLTYVQAATAAGVASTLTVRVADVAWKEVPTTYGAGPTDRVFTTRLRPDGGIDVVFGDGVNGRRLPTNSQNVRATYRKGRGSAGNVAAGTLSQPMDRPLGLAGVTNPLPAVGGVDPEPASRARSAIPLPVRTLGRAVSLRDYSDFALAFAGIGLADATALPLRAGPTVVVTVAGPDAGSAAPTTVTRLAATLRQQGDPHVPVTVVLHTDVRFRLALKVARDPDHDWNAVRTAVEAVLRSAFAPRSRRLGQTVHRSEVIAVAAGVPGVAAIDLDQLYRTGAPRLEDHLVAAPTHVDAAGAAVGAELISLADDLPSGWVQEMTP